MPTFQHGYELACNLCDALGIDRSQYVTRIVIVADVNDAAKVYVVRNLTAEHAHHVLDVLVDRSTRPEIVEVKDAQVDDRGNVKVVR